MHPFLRQLRVVLRGLGRTRLFTAVAVLTLALGIGATTAVFSVVHGVLLKPLPYPEPDRLVGIWHEAPGLGVDRLQNAPALDLTYRQESELMEAAGMYSGGTAAVTRRGEPERVEVVRTNEGALSVLGLRPLLGRVFTPADDAPGSPETVILSHAWWQSRLGGDRSVLGQTLVVDGTPREIVGVLGPDQRFPEAAAALVLPLRIDPAEVFFGNFSYRGVARLRPGVTLEQAEGEMERMVALAVERFPMPVGFTREMMQDLGFAPALSPLKEDVVGDVGDVLWVLLGTVGIVLLVACANVANLLLVRAEGRRQELAVRSALGAGKGRLSGELLLESLVLGVAGGAAGVGLAAAGLRLLRVLDPRNLPRIDEIGLEPAVLLFAFGVSLLSALVFGLLPVFRLDPSRLASALRSGGRGASAGRDRQIARSTLVAAQVALALVLIIGSGLMLRSFQALRTVDPGFRDPSTALALRLSVPEAEVEDVDRVLLTYEEILQRLESLPGVESAGVGTSVPMGSWNSNDPIFVEDFPTRGDTIPPIRRFKWIAPGYFETLGNLVLLGRDLTWTDVRERRPVAVVTENLAREYWADPADALGRRIRPYPDSPWREIVGVVGDVHDDGVDQEATAVVYWPLAVRDFFGEGDDVQRNVAFVVRSPRVGSEGFLDEVRSAVWAVDPNLPVSHVRTLEEVLEASRARTTFTLVMLAIAAGTALLLGAVGIYGVTAYLVTQRRRELGVRMALGARPVDVRRLVLRRGVVLAGVGAMAGLVAAVGVTRVMEALLYGVGALDRVAFGWGVVGVLAVALLASWLPAWRAGRIDPVETLR